MAGIRRAGSAATGYTLGIQQATSVNQARDTATWQRTANLRLGRDPT